MLSDGGKGSCLSLCSSPAESSFTRALLLLIADREIDLDEIPPPPAVDVGVVAVVADVVSDPPLLLLARGSMMGSFVGI